MTDTPERPAAPYRLYRRVAASAPARWLYAHRRWLPLVSFTLGWASFFLVQRQAQLAQWLTALLLLGWVWLLAEGLITRKLARLVDARIPETAARFAAQALHQETLFFVLPFFLVTTNWRSGQIAYTGSLILAAGASTIDPIYFDRIAARRWLFLAYHAFTLFAALLAGLPIMLHLTTGQSLELAAVLMAVFALPSLASAIRVQRWWRYLLLGVLALALAGTAWLTRFWIPPATLHVTETAITRQLNRDTRTPRTHLQSIPAAQLGDNGVYAFTAIRAPRGLRQPVLHVWVHNGKVVDRIQLHIVGGRSQGYRAWSHKLALGEHPQGRWQVRVMTDDGQLLGVIRFRIT